MIELRSNGIASLATVKVPTVQLFQFSSSSSNTKVHNFVLVLKGPQSQKVGKAWLRNETNDDKKCASLLLAQRATTYASGYIAKK